MDEVSGYFFLLNLKLDVFIYFIVDNIDISDLILDGKEIFYVI